MKELATCFLYMQILCIFLARKASEATPVNFGKQTKTEEQRLLYHLLQGYERAVRPVKNSSNPIVVKLGLTLTNIFDMDEKNQVLTTNVWLDQEWRDELLTWDPKEFGGIESIRVPCDLIWLPDIVLYNNADDYTTGYMRARAMVYFDGTVFWPPPTQLRSTCKMYNDVTYFPFDSQRCFMKFGSWTYHGFQVDVTNRSTNVDLTNYVVSGEFDLVKVYQKRRVVKYTCCPEPYPDVTFFIIVRRKTLYYMYNVVFPCMMMSALTLLVFCLPPDSGEKIALGITVLLAFSVFVLAIAEKMPETSDSMPLIGIYLTVVMGMTSISVVMTVMVLNFHHRGPFHKEIPDWVRSFILDKLRRLLCMRLPYPNLTQFPADRKASSRRSNALSPLRLQHEVLHNVGIATDTFLYCDDSSLGGTTGSGGDREPQGNHVDRLATTFTYQDQQPSNSARQTRRDRNVGNVELQPLRQHQQQQSTAAPTSRRALRAEMQEEILKILQALISRQELEDESEEIANEWRQVAQVIDRLLFWIFLAATVVITLILLIVIPLVRHAKELAEMELQTAFEEAATSTASSSSYA